MTVAFNNGISVPVLHAPGLADGALATFVHSAYDGVGELAYHIDAKAPAEARNGGVLEMAGVDGAWSICSIRNAALRAGIRVLKLERVSNG